MAGLLNWPPSRGKNPHTHKSDYVVPVLGRRDLSKPKKRRISQAEKAVIDNLFKTFKKCSLKGKKGWKLKPRKPFPRPALVGRWRVLYQVVDVASLTLEQAVRVLRGWDKTGDTDWWNYKPRTLRVTIDYPLNRSVVLRVPPMERIYGNCKACAKMRGRSPKPRIKKDMTIGYFMWVVAKEYERIYRQHRKYGVWGHAIGDLAFESIEIDEKGVVRMGIGS